LGLAGPGDALPATSAQRGQWGVVRSTVIKALHVLTAEGLMTGVQGWGVIVRNGD
jgi:DNA-binding GntR family transcriptional regulator